MQSKPRVVKSKDRRCAQAREYKHVARCDLTRHARSQAVCFNKKKGINELLSERIIKEETTEKLRVKLKKKKRAKVWGAEISYMYLWGWKAQRSRAGICKSVVAAICSGSGSLYYTYTHLSRALRCVNLLRFTHIARVDNSLTKI